MGREERRTLRTPCRKFLATPLVFISQSYHKKTRPILFYSHVELIKGN